MTEKENEHTAPSRLFGGGAHPAPLHWLFFPAAVLYHELLLRAFDAQSVFFDGALALILLFAVGTGLFWSLIVNLLRRPRAAFIVSVTVTALWSVLVCVEYCCRSYFKSYFFLRFIGNMSENVVTGFGSAMGGGTGITGAAAEVPAGKGTTVPVDAPAEISGDLGMLVGAMEGSGAGSAGFGCSTTLGGGYLPSSTSRILS